jgi:hypothetical protein
MNQELNQTNEQSNTATPQREWVEPTFERMTLKEAMTGTGKFTYSDGITYAS